MSVDQSAPALSTRWAPREARKLHSLLDTGKGGTWWAPGAVGWWIGVLFAIGAGFFALGAAPGYVYKVGNKADAITFFIGSIRERITWRHHSSRNLAAQAVDW